MKYGEKIGLSLYNSSNFMKIHDTKFNGVGENKNRALMTTP